MESKDRQKLEAYYTNFDNYNFKLTESKTNERKTISSKEAKQYARLQQIRKDAQNVKKQYTIYGESKDHIAYVEFDIMIVGGKQYLGKRRRVVGKLKKNSQNVKETLTFFFNSTIVVLDRNTR